MKIAMLIPAAAALALAACAEDNTNNAAPPTTNLTVETDPAAVDQAINQTDQQSDLGNVADEAVNGVSNSVE